jgi:peptidoglycan/LPS O-acetylase OafA/YrhL
MWSVAVEWQIYFLFPLILLPVYRRWGAAAAVAAGLAVGLIPHFISSARFDAGHGWFLGLFAMGMAGATINFRDRPAERSLLEKLPWGVLSAVLALLVVGISSVQNKSSQHSSALRYLRFETWGGSWPIDVLVGLSTICLVIYCTHQLSKPTLSKYSIVRVFDSRLMIWVGAFSYSIYLVHDPVLELIWLMKYHMSATTAIILFQVIGLPAAVGCAYLFHIAFERPFLSSRKRADRGPQLNLVPPPEPVKDK